MGDDAVNREAVVSLIRQRCISFEIGYDPSIAEGSDLAASSFIVRLASLESKVA